MTAVTNVRHRRPSWVVRLTFALVVVTAGLLAIPLLALATIPPDEPAAPWVAPYVDVGRQSLTIADDLTLPHFRFIGTRCAGDMVALLFERRIYPYLGASGAYAITGLWPPDGPGAFGGALYVEHFDEDLKENWLPRQDWHACEPH